MGLDTIEILSPGDMGHGVGRVLADGGYRVITCLAGRSRRTRELTPFTAGECAPVSADGTAHRVGWADG